jgi:DNA-directed RNA polymerase subunit RPC12/RpoP
MKCATCGNKVHSGSNGYRALFYCDKCKKNVVVENEASDLKCEHCGNYINHYFAYPLGKKLRCPHCKHPTGHTMDLDWDDIRFGLRRVFLGY